MEYEDYYAAKERERNEAGEESVRLNPHQFGDQLTLFHATLNQPEAGVVRGHPQARLYRSMQVPNHHTDPHSILQYASRPGRDSGVQRSLGLHWQHDLTYAQDLASTVHGENWGRHGENGHAVILEADHPGFDHVVTHDTAKPGSLDEKVINQTVGPKEENEMLLPEVHTRPGAPMVVRAVHTPHPTRSGEFIRHAVNFKGQA